MECDNSKYLETSNLIIIINMIKIIKIQCSFYVRVCRKYSYGQFNKNDLFARVCMCICWESISLVGPSKEDKKLTLLTSMCMRVCICERDRKYGPFVFLSLRVRFLWSLATTCRVPVVSKRTSHISSLCVLCAMPSAVCRPCLW